MKRMLDNFACRLAALAVGLLSVVGVQAKSAEAEPALTLRTSIYETYGAQNSFSILLGTTDTVYIDVDCGFGKVEYEAVPVYYDEDAGGITGGVVISCQVSEAGTVKIYCDDASLIDYLNADGCYITNIDLSQLVNLEVLSLCHNELQSLDLSVPTRLTALYLSDNPFTEATPLVIGEKPELLILEVTVIDWFDPDFDLTRYPKLASFDAYHNPTLRKIDPSKCPDLVQLTLELTNVSELDVRANTELRILNISETAITSIDVSQNTKLQQLYCAHGSGTYNTDVKLSELDVTHNTDLLYLICGGNNFTSLDVSKCPYLITLHAQDNLLTSLDLSHNSYLGQVYIERNHLDFVTLPVNPGTWSDYRYEPLPMPTERSYQEGTVLDFSSRVLRDDATTDVALYYTLSTEPDNWQLLDQSYYTYADGKITLQKAYGDSILVAFANSRFPEANLHTEKFMVKTAEDYGKPSVALEFGCPYGCGNFSVGILGATPEQPKEFLVVFGQDTATYYATTQGLPAEPNVQPAGARYPVQILMPEGAVLTAFGIAGTYISTIDLTKALSLEELSLVDVDLYAVNMENNRSLRSLTISGNKNLKTLTLEGVNQLFNKNVLSTIDLSNNALEQLTLNDLLSIRQLNLSGNKLSGIDFSDADYLRSIDVSDNQFTELKFTYCSLLDTLKASGNLLTSVILPTENNIRYLALDNNRFTLATLPRHGNLAENSYLYAPQADLQIATKGPCTDLSEQYIDLNGNFTTYIWKTEDGTILTEGTDYTIENGFTRFLNTEVGNIRCELQHPAYPAFSGDNVLKTTYIEAAGMPTNQIAQFTTIEDGNAVQLSLAAAANGTALYIDWEGNGNVIQYVLKTTYDLFSATTHAGATVRVYTYEPEEYITVFSMSGAKLADFDGSQLAQTTTLTVKEAGLSKITLPEEKTMLQELNLDGNALTDINLSEYPNLKAVFLNTNELTTIDLSHNPRLQVAGLAENALSTITLNNPEMFILDLTTNRFADIALDGVPALEQLGLGNNLLDHIDVSGLTKLKVLMLYGNNFTFNTLPPVLSSYALYQYHNQAPLPIQLSEDRQVDLSSQALVNGVETNYAWFIGDVVYNSETGEMEGEQLYVDMEYTIENGITTFLKGFDDAVCILTNTEFPDLMLYTNYIDVPTALKNVFDATEITVKVVGGNILVEAESGNAVSLYGIDGRLLRTVRTENGEALLADVAQGAYVLTVGDKACKLMVR